MIKNKDYLKELCENSLKCKKQLEMLKNVEKHFPSITLSWKEGDVEGSVGFIYPFSDEIFEAAKSVLEREFLGLYDEIVQAIKNL